MAPSWRRTGNPGAARLLGRPLDRATGTGPLADQSRHRHRFIERSAARGAAAALAGPARQQRAFHRLLTEGVPVTS